MRFIDDAIRRGASAVLTDRPVDLPESIGVLRGDDLPTLAGILAERFHGNPSHRLRLVGITGTNGKTTTAYILQYLLQCAGERCGLIGTIATDDGDQRLPSQLTTPGAMELSALLRRMVDNGCSACVMEASSHALAQGRVDALAFDAAVFTNLSGDHLDYHTDMSAYQAAKARLFEKLNPDTCAIVNGQDPAWRRMVENSHAEVQQFGIAHGGSAAHELRVYAEAIQAGPRATQLRIVGPWGASDVTLPLIGRHNVMNLLAAVTAASALQVDMTDLPHWAASCPPVPGRLEIVKLSDETTGPPFTVLVDYAHTDDALENVLRCVRPLVQGKLRILFGAGGDRDATKRPRMGAVAARWADDVLITSDNPRSERPEAIIEQILAGVPQDNQTTKTEAIVDRRQAIEAIITRARPGDVVLLAGKGHETYQIIGENRISFDDRAEARRVLGLLTEREQRT
jgi:UDP-N-acetylmuramyl-tripeptide synthetase